MVKYERGLSHSYVIFTDEEKKADDLTINMLRESNIEGLLPVKVSVSDFCFEVAYEISGYHAMNKLFENKRIFNEQIMLMLETMLSLTENLEAYYLEPENLVLDPENIYWSDDLNKVCFCYDYTSNVNNKEALMKLADLILVQADYYDYKSTVYAYEFRQAVLSENFSLEAVIEKLKGVGVPSYLERMEEPAIVAENNMEYMKDSDDEEVCKQDNKAFDNAICDVQMSEEADGIIKEMAELSYDKTDDDWENDEPTGKLFSFSRKKKNKKEKSKGKVFTEETDFMEESFFHVGKVDSPGENKIYEVKRYVIISVDGGEKAISIENYPFLVGSLQHAVDGCIDGADISRFHARFDQNMGKVYLSDLNSVTGTFLNGERLKGSIQKEIKSGDSIKFGKHEFVIT